MEDGTIQDSQITGSSYNSGFLNSYRAYFGRLHNGNPKYWATSSSNPSNPWFQIDFEDTVEIAGIQMQGGANSAYPTEYITEVKIQTGNSEDSLVFINDDVGNEKVRTIYRNKVLAFKCYLF